MSDEYEWIHSIYDFFVEPVLKKARKNVLNHIKSGKIIDLCCGTGTQAVMIGKKYKKASVVGIDMSPEMLGEAKKKKKRLHLDNLKLIEGDASDTKLKRNTFDAATIQLALHEKKPQIRKKIITETKRLLKKKGILIVVDYGTPKKTLAAKFYQFIITVAERVAGKEHYSNYRQYSKSGRLYSGLLNGFDMVEQKEFLDGNILVVALVKK